MDKIINGKDYEVKEVIYVNATNWICVNKLGATRDLLSKKATMITAKKFSFV